MPGLSKRLESVPFLFKGEMGFFKELLQELPPNPKILEIGTFRGLSAILFARTRKDAKIITIDTHEGVMGQYGPLTSSKEEVMENIRKAGVENQIQHFMISSEFYEHNEEIDMLFIDGDHSYLAVSRDFNRFKKFVKKGGYIIFHDYGKFPGVSAFCSLLRYGKGGKRFKSLFIIRK